MSDGGFLNCLSDGGILNCCIVILDDFEFLRNIIINDIIVYLREVVFW